MHDRVAVLAALGLQAVLLVLLLPLNLIMELAHSIATIIELTVQIVLLDRRSLAQRIAQIVLLLKRRFVGYRLL